MSGCCKERRCRAEIQVEKLMRDPPLRAGPFLMLVDTHFKDSLWKGSVLMLVRSNSPMPSIHVTAPKDTQTHVSTKGTHLADVGPYCVYKWLVYIGQAEHTLRMKYRIEHGDWAVEHLFLVPGKHESWKFAMFSCNGLSHTSGYGGYAEKYNGVVGMWADLLRQHHKRQFHAMIGLGDQVYMDCVWEHTKSLDKWTRIASHVKRETMQPPQGMAEEVEDWILYFYIHHFGEAYFRDALAKIPYMMIGGDHDFMDGFGSYPAALEECPVMLQYRQLVTKYFLLFQLHVSPSPSAQCRSRPPVSPVFPPITPCPAAAPSSAPTPHPSGPAAPFFAPGSPSPRASSVPVSQPIIPAPPTLPSVFPPVSPAVSSVPNSQPSAAPAASSASVPDPVHPNSSSSAPTGALRPAPVSPTASSVPSSEGAISIPVEVSGPDEKAPEQKGGNEKGEGKIEEKEKSGEREEKKRGDASAPDESSPLMGGVGPHPKISAAVRKEDRRQGRPYPNLAACPPRRPNEATDEVPYFGVIGYNWLKNLGERIRVLGLDTRLERTREQIVAPETYDAIFEALYRNYEESEPKPVHLLVCAEIPLIASDLRSIEKFFDWFSRVRRGRKMSVATKHFSLSKTFGFPFGEPVLLTDMIDRWNSTYHMEERNTFLKRLQQFCTKTHVRVTFVGGDVHMAGFGKFATPSAADDVHRRHHENQMLTPFNGSSDPKLMYQIVTSAIGNVPPPNWAVTGYHWMDYTHYVNDPDSGTTMARMLRLFKRNTAGKHFGKGGKKFMGLRNWCSGEYCEEEHSLFFDLYVELFLGAGQTITYDMRVPPLNSAVSRSYGENYCSIKTTKA